MRILMLLALTLSAGCGTPADGSEPTTVAGQRNGSRLKLYCTNTGDGARECSGFFDTALQARCTFLQLEDGAQHCVPEPLAYLPAQQEQGGFYTDPACLNSLARTTFDTTCGAGPIKPAVLVQRSEPSCPPAALRLKATGAQWTGSVYVAARPSGGRTCTLVDTTVAAYSASAFYPAGPDSAADLYVSAVTGPSM